MIEAPAYTTTPAHPVRWFVAVVATIAAIFVGLWWAGLVHPRVEVEASSDDNGVVTIEVVNHGPLAVEVVGADAPLDTGAGWPSLALDRPIEVPPGGSARAAVTASADSCLGNGQPFLRLEVRTAVGIDRFVEVPHPHLITCYG